MSSTVSAVVKKPRLSPIASAQLWTAAAGGGVRSDAPIARWSAGQRSASSPVPRWSIATSRSFFAAGPNHSRARAMNGSAGSPGPPVRITSTGASFAPATATRRSSVSSLPPDRSSGTRNVEHVASATSGHGSAPRNRGRDPASARCGVAVASAAVAVGCSARRCGASDPPHPASPATTTATTHRRIA